ncbi:MAG: tetratricopeptide repeat protein [Oscillatoria sp. PMC 1068.18]|nr:tetratricopeptide repeat protein [Oscillatoria sp. PMC 1076.18]MEC4987599.1 tetratricopeptide repeat protein [Oscillatoria sp. PMC 1068.18]
MRILHLDLKLPTENYAELRYFSDNPNKYQSRRLPLAQIAELIAVAEQDYYVRLAVDYRITGKKLYHWLDGEDRWLDRLLQQFRREGVVLAISAAGKLAHIPWEILHDEVSFFVQKFPAIIPVRWLTTASKQLSVVAEPRNRALNLLFMATSPLNVQPVLDFEAEEGRILTATARQPLSLKVEESGCLSELGYLVSEYEENYFDVFHLMGHATFQNNEPRFITETETGEANYASAEDIARELQFRLPKLIFLSGCRTGQANQAGAIPSMAESLLNCGAKAVLGWGEKVLDSEATAAAEALYQALAAGKKLTEAVALTYQALLKNQARDWHLLRLYVADSLPGNLVTSLRTRGRIPAPPQSVATEFLDGAGQVKVATRESFVGRRRQLQNCLRVLLNSTDEIGVLIHGMGGLGKSSLAARLCDRLTDFERVVWVGYLDEASLVNRLTEKLNSQPLREALQNPHEELKFRLKQVFQQRGDAGEKPFLLVLDDFELNLQAREQTYVLQTDAVEVLKSLVWAIRETYTSHRIIITSRYDFQFTEWQYFYKQPLEALHGADLRKKCSRLEAFNHESSVEKALQTQAQNLADGNPRLLEWLDKLLRNPDSISKFGGESSVAAILTELETNPVELREQVLAESLLEQIDAAMREMLSRGLIFKLPVPREALARVCENIPNLEILFQRGVALGLLEVSPDESLRVPRILPLPQPPDAENLAQSAAEVLYRLWYEEAETSSEEQRLEIHRLALLGKIEAIAVKMAIILTIDWLNESRFCEAEELSQATLEIAKDYRVRHSLARSEKELGKVSQAQTDYQQALDDCPEEDESEKASILHNLGGLKANTGDIQGAIALFEQSLILKEQIGNLRGKAATLNELGNLKANMGKFDEAIALYQQSLTISEQIDDVFCKATTLNNLGRLKADSGDIQGAIALFHQALTLQEQIGNIQGIAVTLNNLGNIKVYLEDLEAAIALFEQSLTFNQHIGDLQNIATNLHNLGVLKANTGKIDEAITLFQQSLNLNEQIGNVQTKAMTLQWLGMLVANHYQDFDTGLNYLHQSWEILKHIQSPEAENVRQYINRVQQMKNDAQK